MVLIRDFTKGISYFIHIHFYTFYRGEKYENDPLCYCSINLLQKADNTLLFIFKLFCFLLIACLTLYHLQSALANQVQDRLSFIGASASTELLPALELASRFYLKAYSVYFFYLPSFYLFLLLFTQAKPARIDELAPDWSF